MRSYCLLSVVLALSGCAIGSSDFACPGRPAGVHCMSTREVYNATNHGSYVPPTSDKPIGDDPSKEHHKHTEPSNEKQATPHEAAMQYVPAPNGRNDIVSVSTLDPAVNKPVPIRTPSQVMRVWIRSWESSKGVLNSGGYSFVEVESRRWVVGDSDPSITPVRTFSIQSAKVDSKEPVGKDQSVQKGASTGSERVVRQTSTLQTKGVSK